MMIHLLEVEALTDEGNLVTRYFGTSPGYVSRPDDDPSNTVYEVGIMTPGTYERHLWQPGTTQGGGAVTVGAVQLSNATGALDAWLDWSFDGRAVRILYGDSTQPLSSFTTVLAGVAQSVGVSEQVVQINLRDEMAFVANAQLISERYGGTNSLPAGVDGTPDDIKGSFRPLVLGEVVNVACPRVNSSRLIYEASRHAISAVVGVYEGGNDVTAGTLRADLAALQASAPTAGTYDWTLGTATEGAYVRLGSSPTLQITASFSEGASASVRTIGQIATRVLTLIGIGAERTRLLADFDDKQTGVVGYYGDTSGVTAGAVLDALCESGGATWTIRRDGQFEILRLEEPSSPPVATLAWWQISEITVAPISADGGLPSYEIDLSYDHNYTTMTGSQVAGVVTAVRVDWLGRTYRQSIASTPSVWNPVTHTGRDPLSQPMVVVTQLRYQTDADLETTRLAILYSKNRRYVTLTVHASVASGLDLGEVIIVIGPRFGYEGGTPHLVIGMSEDRAAETTKLFCWR